MAHYESNEHTSSSPNISQAIAEAEAIQINEMHDMVGSLVVNINFFSTVFGIFSNLLCICVFSQKSLLTKKINWYLLILSLTDFLFCLILCTHYFMIKYKSNTLYDWNMITCYGLDYLVGTTDTYSVYLMLVLSIDRLYAIIRPIESKQFYTNRFCKRIALIGFFAILILKSPDLFLNQRVYNYTPKKSAAAPSAVEEALSHIGEHDDPFAFLDSVSNNSVDENLKKNFAKHGIDAIYELVVDRDKIASAEDKTDYFEQWLSLDMIFPSSEDDKHTVNHDCVGRIFIERYDSEKKKQLITYIIHSNMVMPALLNIVSALAILMINFMLWSYIRRYSKKSQLTENLKQGRNLTKMQKSYYMTIIVLGVWLLIVSIPYHLLVAYRWAAICGLITTVKSLIVAQIISTVFWNSSHFINIIIYLIFHRDFRNRLLLWFIWLFNLNYVVKMNPLYFDIRTPSENNFPKASMYSIPKANSIRHNQSNSFLSDAKNSEARSVTEFEMRALKQYKNVRRQSQSLLNLEATDHTASHDLIEGSLLVKSASLKIMKTVDNISPSRNSNEALGATQIVKQKLFIFRK